MKLTAEISDAFAVVWLLNGEEVSDKFKAKQDGDNYSLTLMKMTAAYAGEYTLEATSPTGHVIKQNFKVDFKGKFRHFYNVTTRHTNLTKFTNYNHKLLTF